MVQNKPAVRIAVAVEVIERRILLLRRHKVMLDSHLAELYEVETHAFWFKRSSATRAGFRRISCSN
jgi:hypothetical protein